MTAEGVSRRECICAAVLRSLVARSVVFVSHHAGLCSNYRKQGTNLDLRQPSQLLLQIRPFVEDEGSLYWSIGRAELFIVCKIMVRMSLSHTATPTHSPRNLVDSVDCFEKKSLVSLLLTIELELAASEADKVFTSFHSIIEVLLCQFVSILIWASQRIQSGK